MKRSSELAAWIRSRRLNGIGRTVVTVRIARTMGAALTAAVLPGLVAALAFGLRIARPPVVFADGHLNFQTADAWYHLRLIDNLSRGFPHGMTADPYVGTAPAFTPLFDFVAAGIAALLGLGAPSDRLVDLVATLLPPALGALTTLVVFALGARLFDRRAGLLAGALVAVMPSPFFGRTLLGFADYHALEAALAVATVALLVRALGAEVEGRTPGRTVRRSAYAGVALGAYVLSWTGGAFLVLTVGAWVIVQALVDHLRGRSSFGLTRAVVPAVVTALAVVALGRRGDLSQWRAAVGSLVLLGAGTALLEAARHVSPRLRVPRLAFPAIALGGIWLGYVALDLAIPDIGARLLAAAIATGSATAFTSPGDTMPLFSEAGASAFAPAWASYRVAWPLGLAGLAMLAFRLARRGARADGLVTIWCAATLAATVAQSRFGYYLGPNLALLTGGLVSVALARIGLDARTAAPGPSRVGLHWPAAVTTAVVVAVVVVPNMPFGVGLVRADTGMGQPRGWHEALEWLRAQTPEPFGESDRYDARDVGSHEQPAYTVLSEREYHRWIARTARRVPADGQTPDVADSIGRFFAEIDEAVAAQLLQELDVRYVLLADDLPFRSAEPDDQPQAFEAMVAAGERDGAWLYERYFERGDDGALEPVLIFHPRYYRTMAVRLAVFGGKATQPSHSSWVITYAQRTSEEGVVYREIVESRRLDSYEEAERYLLALGPGPHRIVGRDPLLPSVPVAALSSFVRRFVAPRGEAAGDEASVLAYEFLGLTGR